MQTQDNSGEVEQAPPTDTPREKRFPVIEIFGPVIQGEGSQAGQQTMFIRFGGCDFRCSKCDSLHAVIPQAIQKHATYMTATEIMKKLREAQDATAVEWVTFSGGNPCMHKLDALVIALRTEGWFINVETQGTLWQDWLTACTTITISPKTGGMGEKFDAQGYTKFLNKLQFCRPVCIKAVIFSSQDFEYALMFKGITHEAYIQQADKRPTFPPTYYLSLGNPNPPILSDENDLVSPPGEEMVPTKLLKSYRDLSEEMLQDPRLKAFRFLPQLHVLVYGNESER